MAFRKKADIILPYNPDILIIPECEHPDKFHFKNRSLIPAGTLCLEEIKIKDLQYFYSETLGLNRPLRHLL